MTIPKQAVEAAGRVAGLSSRLVGIVKASDDPELRTLALETQVALIAMATAINALPLVGVQRPEDVARAVEDYNRTQRPDGTWASDEHEDYRHDNPMFNRGVTHTVELLAKTLGISDWTAGDGSEDYDEDLAQTLLNIVEAKGLYSSEDGSWAARPHTGQPQEGERSVTVGMVTAALAAIGEHDVSLASNRRRQVTKMIQAAVDWQSSLAAPAPPRAEGEDPYLVWSNEHRAWWRPDCRGYTIHLEAAGRYTREDAIKHSQSRDPGNPPPEIPVREADAIAALLAEKREKI